MTPEDPLRSLRLSFKRAFTGYYLELLSPAISDPTPAFGSSYDYLSALLDRLGPGEFMRRLDDETTHLAGEVEQDLRHRSRGKPEPQQYEDLEDRLRECLEYGLGRLKEEARLQGPIA